MNQPLQDQLKDRKRDYEEVTKKPSKYRREDLTQSDTVSHGYG
ncbi:hypothetical protein J14TS2_16240 [Bacillus sp. J14TS2]|nr:hypothetical protein [Bacillus sp. J14TS2]GIN71149.1 hypothetical protein J14TS2_16240 [Bacillus sp. J14TS2]